MIFGEKPKIPPKYYTRFYSFPGFHPQLLKLNPVGVLMPLMGSYALK